MGPMYKDTDLTQQQFFDLVRGLVGDIRTGGGIMDDAPPGATGGFRRADGSYDYIFDDPMKETTSRPMSATLGMSNEDAWLMRNRRKPQRPMPTGY